MSGTVSLTQNTNRGNKWLTLLAVTLAFMYTFLSRYIWSPLSTTVSAEFGITVTQAALYMSAFFAGYLITQLPGGVLADRFQPKVILIICTLLGALATGLVGLAPGYAVGLVLRIITGVSSGCVMASCSKIVALNFPGPQRATGMGILLAAPPVGITLANQIGPRLNAAIGWRNTFFVTAGIGLLIILLILLLVHKLPAVAAAPNKPKTGVFEGLRLFFTDKQQLICGLSGFLFMFANVGFATWANSYAQSLGYTAVQGGTIITAYSIAGVAGSVISGGLARALKMSHRNFLLLTLGLMGVLTLVFSFVRGYVPLILVGVLYGLISYLPSTHYTTLAQMRAGDQYAASATAAQNFIFQSSGLVQPAIIGLVLDSTGNQSLTWYIFAGCLALGIVFCLFVKQPAQQTEKAVLAGQEGAASGTTQSA